MLFFFSSCGSEKNNSIKSPVSHIDLLEAFQQRKKQLSSDFVSSFEYVRLETNDKTLMRGRPTVYTIGDKYLIIKSHQKISLFDRNDGSFIRNIGHYGNDPQGYLSSLLNLGVNEKDKTVYAKGWRFDILEYSIDQGKIVRQIPRVDINDSIGPSFYDNGSIGSYGMLKGDKVVAFIPNLTGSQKFRLVIYDFQGNYLYHHPNYQTFINTPIVSFDPSEGMFYSFNNELMFKESFNDTLFRLEDKHLIPKLILQMGEYSPPYAKKDEMSYLRRKEFMFIMKMVENSNNIFFQLSFKGRFFMCRYDKNKGVAYVSSLGERVEWNGFYNDVDNFIPFYPSLINERKEIIGLVTAEEVHNWFINNPDKIDQLPPKMKELRNLDPEDNPVIMIGKPAY